MGALPLSVQSECFEEQDLAVLTLKGPLDGQTYDQLGSKLDRLIHHGYRRIIIDLAGVDYISSAGVGVFIAARSKANNEKGCVVLLNLTEQVTKVFDLLQIREHLEIAANMAEARKMLGC
jgi:anti-sigma B factor antagonist